MCIAGELSGSKCISISSDSMWSVFEPRSVANVPQLSKLDSRGIFEHGKASLPRKRIGRKTYARRSTQKLTKGLVPDLAFSEMAFLAGREHQPNENFQMRSKHSEREEAHKPAKVRDISGYFQTKSRADIRTQIMQSSGTPIFAGAVQSNNRGDTECRRREPPTSINSSTKSDKTTQKRRPLQLLSESIYWSTSPSRNRNTLLGEARLNLAYSTQTRAHQDNWMSSDRSISAAHAQSWMNRGQALLLSAGHDDQTSPKPDKDYLSLEDLHMLAQQRSCEYEGLPSDHCSSSIRTYQTDIQPTSAFRDDGKALKSGSHDTEFEGGLTTVFGREQSQAKGSRQDASSPASQKGHPSFLTRPLSAKKAHIAPDLSYCNGLTSGRQLGFAHTSDRQSKGFVSMEKERHLPKALYNGESNRGMTNVHCRNSCNAGLREPAKAISYREDTDMLSLWSLEADELGIGSQAEVEAMLDGDLGSSGVKHDATSNSVTRIETSGQWFLGNEPMRSDQISFLPLRTNAMEVDNGLAVNPSGFWTAQQLY